MPPARIGDGIQDRQQRRTNDVRRFCRPGQSGPYANYRELTLRGMVLGALITVVFTASNVYLGLKVGLTFASSIRPR